LRTHLDRGDVLWFAAGRFENRFSVHTSRSGKKPEVETEFLRSLGSQSGSRTTHNRKFLPTTLKICYFQHPFYNQQVKVVGKRDFEQERFFIVQLFDNSVFLPAWMADADYCHRCQFAEQPQCSVSALLELAKLVDSFEFIK